MRKRPETVFRCALVVSLCGPALIVSQWLVLKTFWDEGPAVRVFWGSILIVATIYLILLILGLWRGHTWVWHAMARGKWNPLGFQAWNDPEIRDHFGVR